MAEIKCTPLPKLSDKDITRFWSKVSKSGDGEDWIWKGGISTDGYGKFKAKRKTLVAHRVSYFIHYGVDPYPSLVCHNCPNGDITLCVNPHHLFLGSPADNMADMVKKGRSCLGDRQGFRKHPERAPMGIRNANAKLTDEKVKGIRMDFSAGVSVIEISKNHGVWATTIWAIIKRKTWKHI